LGRCPKKKRGLGNQSCGKLPGRAKISPEFSGGSKKKREGKEGHTKKELAKA